MERAKLTQTCLLPMPLASIEKVIAQLFSKPMQSILVLNLPPARPVYRSDVCDVNLGNSDLIDRYIHVPVTFSHNASSHNTRERYSVSCIPSPAQK